MLPCSTNNIHIFRPCSWFDLIVAHHKFRYTLILLEYVSRTGTKWIAIIFKQIFYQRPENSIRVGLKLIYFDSKMSLKNLLLIDSKTISI